VKKLEGKAALVTGSGRGIGRAIALALAREGATVAVNCHQSAPEARSVVDEIQGAGGMASEFLADATQPAAVNLMVQQVVERFGRLDILVNNAGWTKLIPHERLDLLQDEVVDRTLGANFKGPLWCIRAAEPYLRASGSGLIVNITSVAGIVGRGSSVIYGAAKAALSLLSRDLARSLAPAIRVNSVAPGFIDTGFVHPRGGEVAARVAERNYLNRLVTPDEVANVVLFLATDGSAITGEEIVVDGGIGRLWGRAR
jgi:3-oxoacyl-[acyl-carrier protein] reductase